MARVIKRLDERTLSPTVKRACRRIVRDSLWDHRDPLTDRAEIKKQLDERGENGQVAIAVWSRDCDLAEGTSMHIIAANVPAFIVFEQNIHENAEGPVSITILTPEEAIDFEPTFRDRAAEMMNY